MIASAQKVFSVSSTNLTTSTPMVSTTTMKIRFKIRLKIRQKIRQEIRQKIKNKSVS